MIFVPPSLKGFIFITAGERSVACGYENLAFQAVFYHQNNAHTPLNIPY
jgi:hypothetical protein